MKKVFFWMVSVLFVLVSCQKENSLEGDGGLTGSFTVEFSSAPSTRASYDNDGNAANVNRCRLQVVWNGKIYLDRYTRVTVNDQGIRVANFKQLPLLSSQDYAFLFWADCVADTTTAEGLSSDLYYNTSDLKSITLKKDYAGNDDARDAFSAMVVKKNISESFQESVTLKRPFAQLNIVTTDSKALEQQLGKEVFGEVFPTKFDISFKAPSKFDVETGVATDSITYSLTGETVYKAFNEDAQHQTLLMEYIFTPDGEETAISTITFSASNPVSPIAFTFTNVPLHRNYRTNVVGNLLTHTGSFHVEVDSTWVAEIE